MSRLILNASRHSLSSWFSTTSDTPPCCTSTEDGCRLEISDLAKVKGLISCMVTIQLICAFFFAYAKSRFSHHIALILQMQTSVAPTMAHTYVTTSGVSMKSGHVMSETIVATSAMNYTAFVSRKCYYKIPIFSDT